MTTLVIDAGMLIGTLDSTDTHHAPAIRALTEIGRADTVVVPASVLAEILVRPYAAGGGAVRDIEAPGSQRLSPPSKMCASSSSNHERSVRPVHFR